MLIHLSRWKFDMGEYLVNAYQPGMFLYCRPKKKPFTHRFPSTATPSFLTAPHTGKANPSCSDDLITMALMSLTTDSQYGG